METPRFILLIALGLVLTMLWQAWQEDYGAEVKDSPVVAAAGHGINGSKTEDIPELITTTAPLSNGETSPVSMTNSADGRQTEIIHVKTDVLDVEINTLGATIQKVALLNYPVEKDKPDQPVHLLKNEANEFYWLQSGVLSKGESINHKSKFHTEKNTYKLDGDSLTASFKSISNNGLQMIKTYVFHRGSYLVDLRHLVINKTEQQWTGRAYAQINRTRPAQAGSRFIHTYTGAVISSPDKRYDKIGFDDITDKKLSRDITEGWAAMLQHYFFTALLPGSSGEQYHYYTLSPNNKSYIIGAATPARTISPGTETAFIQKIYFGPKLQKQLKEIADGLELTVDYGIFWPIAKPLYWILDFIHNYTHNWGWAIILVTLFLKVLFYRLSAAGYRSMANMRRVQPRLVAIKERYKNDRAGLNQAMMNIYKEEKINPLGGCFPILIQIPVFISLYWVLLETVELRQARFILWIDDLSAADPYFILPLLMGMTMFIQQKLNPAPMDPVQEKIMSALPIIFTIFFAFFPSGLVLYWVSNNALSITQQWLITRNIKKTSAK